MTALLPKAGLPSTPPSSDEQPAAMPSLGGRARSTAEGMSARNVVVAVAALIAVTAAVALFIGQARDGGGEAETNRTAQGRPAPTFTLPELRPDRGEVSLVSNPDEPTVLNFFAAWCEPCKRELPALKAAAEAHPDVRFLGIDHQDSRQDAIELLDRFGIAYPAGYDPRGDIAAKYFVRGFPSTVFIGTDGRIAAFHQGELSAQELEAELDRLTLRSAAS